MSKVEVSEFLSALAKELKSGCHLLNFVKIYRLEKAQASNFDADAFETIFRETVSGLPKCPLKKRLLKQQRVLSARLMQ
jgi:hypothetical protein